MTVNDLFENIAFKFDAVFFWFTDGFGKVVELDFMNLTLGQRK